MSDIVERLRNAFPHGHENTDVPTYADDVLMHEAAAEIERLRAIIVALETDCPDCESAHEARVRAMEWK